MLFIIFFLVSFFFLHVAVFTALTLLSSLGTLWWQPLFIDSQIFVSFLPSILIFQSHFNCPAWCWILLKLKLSYLLSWWLFSDFPLLMGVTILSQEQWFMSRFTCALWQCFCTTSQTWPLISMRKACTWLLWSFPMALYCEAVVALFYCVKAWSNGVRVTLSLDSNWGFTT